MKRHWIPTFWKDRHLIVGDEPGVRRFLGVVWFGRSLTVSYWKPRKAPK